MSAMRPLPPRPSLEFERKEAKAFLRQLRAGNPDALQRARAQHSSMRMTSPDALQLADAQLVIAREYGFTSWPRLVRYFEDVERLLKRTPSSMNPGLYRPDQYPQTVQHFITRHQRRTASAARSLIAFVPRFYGRSLEEAFDIAVTEDEARLAVARGNGFPSWEALMARVEAQAKHPLRQEGLELPPIRRASEAMRDSDLPRLQAIVDAHPELLAPSEYEIATRVHLLAWALDRERENYAQQQYRDRMRPIIEWLASKGFDIQRELDHRLCGHMMMTPEEVQYWIDRGANPNWVAPNGFSVLEHAVVRYWNPRAVDRLAQYATVRQPALWIAAGLGDVEGVGRFLDRNGRPTDAARKNRVQFDAIGPHALPQGPDDDDDEILMEVAMVAFVNERTAVMEYLVARGFPIDTLRWDMPFVVMAVGNNKVELVETLVRRGANLDLRGASNGSAREMARQMVESQPRDAGRRRIAELCGLDVDAILAERDAQPPSTPTVSERLARVLAFATDDAHRLGHALVTPEHLLVGLLRAGFPAVYVITQVSGLDRETFRADMGDRVRHAEETIGEEPLSHDSDAQVALDAATYIVAEHRRKSVEPQHLLTALARSDDGVVAQTIKRYGGSIAKVREFLEKMR